MITVSEVSGVSGNGSQFSNPALADTALAKSGFSQETFLNLLVTQLKNQDPLDPQDSSAFVAELAQFSSLEQMANLNKSMNTILELSVTGAIGRTVTLLDSATGNSVTGVVEGITYYADGPAVKVNGKDYAWSMVQNIV